MATGGSVTPLWAAVSSHVMRAGYPFHVPGHKQGRGLSPEFAHQMPRFDLTELPGLDNLLAPHGPLREAERLAAAYTGAAACHFTTGGSTSGIIASIMALCPRGKRILLPRNAHISCLHACVLGDFTPVFYDVIIDEARQIFLGADHADFQSKLSSDIGVALVVSPNYHGIISDVSELAELCHKASIPLVVDEAHGTHLLLGPPLPASAVRLGADVVVQSVHKTGTALTGAAWVNVKHWCHAESVKAALRLVQSTSPSFLQLVSLDLARAYFESHGAVQLAGTMALADNLRELLPVYVPPHLCLTDPLRIVVDASRFGMHGFLLGEMLAMHGVSVEMSDISTAVLVLTLADDIGAVHAVSGALRYLPTAGFSAVGEAAARCRLPAVNPFSLPPKDAYFSEYELLPLDRTLGRIAAAPITVYPPGSPLIWPGQRIESDFIEYIYIMLAQGASVTGVEDDRVKVIK